MKLLRPAAALAALALAAGCSTTTTAATSTADAGAAAQTVAAAALSTSVADDVLADNQESHADDNDASVDAAEVTEIELTGDGASAGDGVEVSGSTITITEPGAYRFTGTLDDGQILVDSAAEGKVQLILAGADISSSSGSPLVISAADKAIVITEDGTDNSITDAKTYADTSEEAPNAAIDSAADLTFAGTGSLTVTGHYNDAINGADGVVIESGALTVTAADDAIRGKDYVIVTGGTLDVTAAGDGLKSDNEEDPERGYVAIRGGDLTISSGDDAIKGYTDVVVDDGTVTITESVEGIEAQTIAIAGGSIDLTSSDDGINVSGDDPQYVAIAGGEVTIDAQGDGFDSNGAAAMTGGTLTVYGPTNDGNGAVDVDQGFDVTGGTVWALGSSGMAQSPSESSTQNFVMAGVDQQASGTVAIQAEDGTVLAQISSDKAFSSVLYSASEVTADGTYDVTVDGNVAATTEANQYQAGMGGGPGGRGPQGGQGDGGPGEMGPGQQGGEPPAGPQDDGATTEVN